MALPPIPHNAAEQVTCKARRNGDISRKTRDLSLFKAALDHEPELIKLSGTDGKVQRHPAAHGRDERLGPAQGDHQLGDLRAKA